MNREQRVALKALLERRAREKAQEPGVIREYGDQAKLGEEIRERADREQQERSRLATALRSEVPRDGFCAVRVDLGSLRRGPRCSFRATAEVIGVPLCGNHARKARRDPLWLAGAKAWVR